MKAKTFSKRFLACLLTLFVLVSYLPFGDFALSTQAADYSKNKDIIFNFLVSEMGLNSAAACGVLANIQHESSFNPTALGDNGTSYGICQWHNGRYTKLKDYCKKYGYDYKTVEGQLQYLKYELQGSYKKSVLNRLASVENTADGAYLAGYYWCVHFEVPANKEAKAKQRGNLAKNTYWPKYKDTNEEVSTVVEKMLTWAVNTANDDSVGYSQKNRLGNPDYDCSSFVAAACRAAGINVSASSTTRTLKTQLEKLNFEWIPWNNINNNTSKLKPGDILLDIGKHTEIYMGNGQNVGAHMDYDHPQGGDKNGKEVSVGPYYNNVNGVSWDGVLRYKSSTSSWTDKVIAFINGVFQVLNPDEQTAEPSGFYYAKMGVYRTLTDLNVRASGTTESNKLGHFAKGTEVEVLEVSSNGWGKVSFGSQTGWISLYNSYVTYVRELNQIVKPLTPVLGLASAQDVALNAINTVNWQAVNGADSYTVKVYNSANTVVWEKSGIQGTSTGFTLGTADEYTVKLWAVNSKYTSDEAVLDRKITVHNPLTVVFVDEDGTEIEKQIVAYGSDASTPAEMPTKKGFTFNGWDRAYTNVTTDLTVAATYSRNKYSVTFYAADGTTYHTQRVYYESAAEEPSAPAAPTGQTFMGWDKQFDYIEDNLDIYPIFKWENADLPIVVSDVTAVRSADGYTINYTLTNYPNDITQLRLVAALKTSEGKLISTTESSAHNIGQEKVYTGSIYVPTSDVASTAEIMIVGKYTVTVPLAVNQKVKVTGSTYTGWSTNEPPSDAQDVQSRTEYRYRTKSYTTSDQASLAGWTYDSKTTGYTDWGNWSEWSTQNIGASDTREVDTKTESKSEVTGYNMFYYCTQSSSSPYYRHYRNFSINGNYSGYGARSSYGEHKNSKQISASTFNNATAVGSGGKSSGTYAGYNKASVTGYNFSGDGGYLWYKGDTIYNNYNVTYYRYRDRSLKTTYKFYKLSEYSEWSTEQPVASDTCIVESRTTYRYIPADMLLKENTDGESRTISGTTEAKYAGKQATLFIYKYYDAADYTNEAVAQTTIGEDGSYSFTFKLREEPTYGDDKNNPTGDFTVALGIEGNSNVMYLDPILAPLPEYTVRYIDHDGTVISEQTVLRGEDAVIPENVPERLGYTFAGWGNSNLNIQGDTDILALYTQNTYVACCIDWMTESVVLQEYHYGDPILPPETTTPEGYAFKGWDALLEGDGIITENIVLSAVYEPIICTVDFVDYDGNIISTQQVEYGSAAELPEALEDDELHCFVGWGTDENLDCVTASMTVKPNFFYHDTTGVPSVSLESGVYEEEQTITLTGPENAEIYFTIDGTDPLLYGVLYKEPIVLTEHATLQCYAVAADQNPSEIVTALYAINCGETYSSFVGFDNLPDYVRENPSVYNITDSTGYRYMMEVEVSSKTEAEALESAGWVYDAAQTVWSDWSEWSTSLTGTSDLMISVEQKDAEPVDTLFYQYEHWVYFNPETQTYQYASAEVEGYDGKWETIKFDTKLVISSFDADGNSIYAYNGQDWFNQTEIIEPITPDIPLQRYRSETRIYTKLSDWTDVLPEGKTAEDADVETGRVYRYQIPNQYMLTVVNEDGETLLETMTNADDIIRIDTTTFEREGYSIGGFYIDDDTEWNMETDSVTDSMTLTVKYAAQLHTVTFLNADGTVLSTQEVESFADADAPIVENLSDEEIFVGWDSEAYLNVLADAEVTAVYQKPEEMPTVALSQTRCYLSAGSKLDLTATTSQIDLESETLVWESTNPEVAAVNDTGEVVALKSGVADVVVTELSTGAMAICMVSVAGTPDSEICVITTSGLSTTEEGTLTGLPLVNNTVEEVLAMFENETLTVTDQDGVALGETDLIGTGSVIVLSDDEGNVIDKKTVVLQGDINGDGKLTLIDAVYVLRYSTNAIELSAVQLAAADVTNDDYVGTMDADQIAAYLVGKGPFYERCHS